MTATPLKLEDALRLSGYTIDTYEYPGDTIATDSGPLVVPPMILSKLVWRRDEEDKTLGSAFYLDRIPTFDPKYAPVQLSLILDRFRYRRLAYDTPDEFQLAVRRWSTLHMGAMSVLRRRYASIATNLPLDDVNILRKSVESGNESSLSESEGTAGSTTAGQITGSGEMTSSSRVDDSTSDTGETKVKGRDAQSDFPQGQLAGSSDYASGAVDRVSDTDTTASGTSVQNGTADSVSSDTQSSSVESSANDRKTETAESSNARESESTESGRTRSVMELLEMQRALFINPDEEFLDGMESLFLGVFDMGETERHPGRHFYGFSGYRW